jgi:hypothetical protein
MIYFLALLPATGLTIAGYFVLFLSARAEGALRTFGRYLGFWTFTLAALLILGAIFAAAHGGHRGFAMRGMHEHAHCPWPEGRGWGPRPQGLPGDAPPGAVAPGPGPATAADSVPAAPSTH